MDAQGKDVGEISVLGEDQIMLSMGSKTKTITRAEFDAWADRYPTAQWEKRH